MSSYLLVIHPAEEGGYWAEFPTLPGCFTQGETIDEVVLRAPEAAESYTEALRDDGQPVPQEDTIVTYIRTEDTTHA